MDEDALMCTSRYFRVVEDIGAGAILAEDLGGRRHRLALIAYDGSRPQPGTWIVAHSGYALAPAEAEEVALTIDELVHAGNSHVDAPRTSREDSKEAS
jgi:hydrogenase maturation factor